MLRLGEQGLVGVLTRTSGNSRGTVVWLNSGSEPHVGPGRAWVEYSRELRVVRLHVDADRLLRMGREPGPGPCPGPTVRPARRGRGGGGGGRAAGARTPAHRPGRSVRGGLDRPAGRPDRQGGRCGRHQSPDVLATRRPGGGRHRLRDQGPPSARDPSLQEAPVGGAVVGPRRPRRASSGRGVVARSHRRHVPILAVFAEGDDGLEFLQDRVGRSWRRVLRGGGPIRSATVAGIDHPMHRHWHRGSMVSAITSWLDVTLPEDPSSRRPASR